jgi:hypothetical protein
MEVLEAKRGYKKKASKTATPYRKVGVKYPPNDNLDTPLKEWRVFKYSDCKKDIDGWVDAENFLPGDCDLVYIKIEGQKTFNGWIHGVNWDGLKLKPGQKIKYWKRKPEGYG